MNHDICYKKKDFFCIWECPWEKPLLVPKNSSPAPHNLHLNIISKRGNDKTWKLGCKYAFEYSNIWHVYRNWRKFFLFGLFFKKTSFCFPKFISIWSETSFENDGKNSQFRRKFIASLSRPPCSVWLHTSYGKWIK